MKNIHKINVNIYITSDEEIKEGDWFLTDDKRVEKCAPDWRAREWHRKIILTTDQDLIKDGVQAIDDEFLQWFVKNPSCEKVEVLRCPIEGLYTIIPKEEPTIVRFPTYYEPKQDLEKEMFELEQQLDIPSNLRWHNSKPKQETTLEEVAERIFTKEKYPTSFKTLRKAFISNVKLQQERSYSEEDMEIVEISSIDANYIPHYQTKEGQLLATKFNVKQFKKK